MKKRLVNIFVAICLCFVCASFSACGKNDEETVLSFEVVQAELLATDTKARIFFNNLDYNYSAHADYERLEEATSFITTLGATLGEQLTQYKKVLDAFSSELETSNTKITREKTLIKIENETQTFEINMDDTSVKIEFKEAASYYLYEFIKVAEDSYICQVVSLGENSNYTIYQYIFTGSVGTFAIGHSTKYVSIYKASLNSLNYPSVNETVFRV